MGANQFEGIELLGTQCEQSDVANGTACAMTLPVTEAALPVQPLHDSSSRFRWCTGLVSLLHGNRTVAGFDARLNHRIAELNRLGSLSIVDHFSVESIEPNLGVTRSTG